MEVKMGIIISFIAGVIVGVVIVSIIQTKK